MRHKNTALGHSNRSIRILFYFRHTAAIKRHRLDNDLVRRVLLLGLVEDVDRPPGLVGNVRDVEAARLLLADALDLLEVLLGQLDLLEVLLDARCGDRLGDDGVAADLGPGKDDLGGGRLVGGCDLLNGVVLDEQRQAEHVVAEGLEW